MQLVLLFLSFLVQTLNVPPWTWRSRLLSRYDKGIGGAGFNFFCRCGRIEKYSLSFSVDNHNLAMKLTIYWQWLPPESGMDMDPILTAPGAGANFQSNTCFGGSNPRYSSDLFHGPHTEVSSRSHTLQQRRLFHRPIAQIPRRQSCQHVRGDVLPRKVFVPDGLYDSRWDSVWSSDLLRFGNVRRFSECDGSV